ncbi:MAG: hypothetical protein R3D56_08340 [Paracoccaceae bacterium]
MTDKEHLALRIRAGFHQKPSNLVWRNYDPSQEGWEETAYFRRKDWSDLALADFNSHPYCFSFFDIRAFPFFWGAMMYISLSEENWECRAQENFLIMWEALDAEPTRVHSDSDYELVEKLAVNLGQVLTGLRIDIIEEYFDFRRSAGVLHDEEATRSFVASLRGPLQ